MGTLRLRVVELEGDVAAVAAVAQQLLAPAATRAQVLAPADGPAANGHVHHWKVDSPNGPTSVGRCECGATRDFANSAAGAGAFNGLQLHALVAAAVKGGRNGRCKDCGHGYRHPDHIAHKRAQASVVD